MHDKWIIMVCIRATYMQCRQYRPDKPKKFMAGLAVRWPGVPHRLAIDANQAAEHVVNLTTALAMQPYKAQVIFTSFQHTLCWCSMLTS